MDYVINYKSWFRRPTFKDLQSLKQFVLYPKGQNLWENLKQNWRSGITVSLVNVPLSISLAAASGASPEQGIQTAFWGGMCAAIFGGSQFNIVGPTGALSGILDAATVSIHEDVLPIIALFCGLICLVVWFFNLDRYIMFIPESVAEGFTLAVALIIGLNQLNSITKVTTTKHAEFYMNVYESIRVFPNADLYSVGFFFINLVPLYYLLTRFGKIPWAIVFTVIGCAFGYLSDAQMLGPIHLSILSSKYPELKRQVFHSINFSNDTANIASFSTALGVAIIAILESLISARIADGMTGMRHSQRREVLGISIANMACGFTGSIPATAALARTALNIKSGATSRISAVIACCFLLLIAIAVLPVFHFIPFPTIAALLVMVAVRMVNWPKFTHMWKYSKVAFSISIMTCFLCLFGDTIIGLVAGALVAIFISADKLQLGHHDFYRFNGAGGIIQPLPKRPDMEYDENHTGEGESVRYVLNGSLTYINHLAHLYRVQSFVSDPATADVRTATLDLSQVHYVDIDGVDVVHEMIEVLEKKEIRVLVTGVRFEIFRSLSKQDWFVKLMEHGHVARYSDTNEDQKQEEAASDSHHHRESHHLTELDQETNV